MGQFKLCEKKEKILQIPLDFFREFGIIMAVTKNESFLVGQKAVLCNGSTADSDSVCLGSNPSRAATMFQSLLFEVWLSLVERCVRDAEAASSSLVTSTSFFKKPVEKLLRSCFCGIF